ncbi:MAG: polyprenyl diphosphate synthase [Patescibacteria group bacterium]
MTTPQHIAIIMDGNRRWAKQNGLPLVEGYRRGIQAFKNAIPAVTSRHIPVATFWGFSAENWKRTPQELGLLFELFRRAIDESRTWLNRWNARLVISGRLEDFPADLALAARNLTAATALNSTATINLALSYGGRDEIQRVARGIAEETKGDPRAIEAVNEDMVNRHLYTAGLPDVDLLIRTGGEKRLSGFLPWQSAYAELYFTNTMWPDFGAEELDKALEDFSQRQRNFGT